jgi:ligand-binding sensor domain-containing protein/serine phosphatase RsbU (regulator of sigma subunit)
MTKRLLFFLAVLPLFSANLFSQQYFFRRYSVEEGLPQSSVYCLMQDSRGYIWMGTDGAGVARFDGKKFETFSKTSGFSTSGVRGSIVRSICEDRKGNIWFGTDGGLTLYDGYGFSTIGKKQGLNGTAVLKIIEGSNGMIWVATNDGGLAGVTLGDSISIINYSRSDGLISDFVFDIYEVSANKLFLGMVGGLSIIEFEDTSCTKIKSIENPGIQSGSQVHIISIEADQEGTVWLGTYGKGLFSAVLDPFTKQYSIRPSSINNLMPDLLIWDIFNKRNNELWIATENNGVLKIRKDKIIGSFNKDNGLISNQILNITEDKEGHTWFATFGQGALMYENEKFINYNEKDGLKGNQVRSIFLDNDEMFYLATEEGVLKFKKEGNHINQLNAYSAKVGLSDVGANTLTKVNKNQIWIGTNYGINIIQNSKLTALPSNNILNNKKINILYTDRNKKIWIGTDGGFGRLSHDSLYFMDIGNGLINNEIQAIIEDKKDRIWMGTLEGLVRLEGKTYSDFNNEDGLTTNYKEGFPTCKVYSLCEDHVGNIWIGTADGGIFKFDCTKDSIPISVIATKGVLSSNTINALYFVNDSMLIAGNINGFDLLLLDKQLSIKNVIQYSNKDGFLGGEIFPNSIVSDNDGFIWFGTKNGLVRYDPRIGNNKYLPKSLITDLRLFFEEVNWKSRGMDISKWTGLPENLVLSYNEKHLTFSFTGFYYNNPDDLEFSYYLENQSKEWSPFSKVREVVFSALAPGKYIFKVKARNKYGVEGETTEYSFEIKPPFWQTPWFFIPALILFVFIIIMIIRIRERNLIKEKVKLEKIVEERTREVVEQKDEIARQRDVVTYQKKEITDSIHYAERIQRAVLPEDKIMKDRFSDYFVLFRPKDIVSGDFYWMSFKNDHVIFTAADCTGHGVPGAFMSMLGVSFLNKIVNESGIVNPDEILNSLRANIISALRQEGTFETTKDGMDIALCSVNLKNRKLMFAGANNPLFLIRKNEEGYELIETQADKMPIGYHSSMAAFTNHELDIRKGDTVYLFSDGFLDQFGGPDGRKFMKKRFKEMLLSNQSLDMRTQREIFNNILEDWINYPPADTSVIPHEGQIDDIILIGVRI